MRPAFTIGERGAFAYLARMAELHVIEPEPRPSVVETLEVMLEMARSGELVSVGVAGATRPGEMVTYWSKSDSFGLLLGAMSRLTFRYQEHQSAG